MESRARFGVGCAAMSRGVQTGFARLGQRGAGWVLLVLCAGLTAGCPSPDKSGGIDNTSGPQWVVQHAPRSPVALVFVHGIFGDTLGTWSAGQGSSFFSLLQQNAEIGPKVDLFAFGYTSKMFEGGSLGIHEAANRLHERLEYHKVLDYPALVFVAHSMGGLVVLRELLTRRELIERVPAVVLYSTPQEGAQIATIARDVANNPGLAQMVPADGNDSLQSLNDEWKALPKRPPVACAYEKRATHGVMVVPWSSATRFCDGPALAIDADHLSIVKPADKDDDALVLLVNTLNRHVLGKQLTAKLETPDFALEDSGAVLTMSDPTGKRPVRLVNAGGTKLQYTLAQFPDRGLWVIPGPGPAEIGPHQTQVLEFVLGYGATEAQYRFVLQSDVAPDQVVNVRVENLNRMLTERDMTSRLALQRIFGALHDQDKRRGLMGASQEQASGVLASTVREAIAERNAGLSEAGLWILTAELLTLVNWPESAVQAVQHAVQAAPALEQSPEVRELAALASGFAGDHPALAGVPARAPALTDLPPLATPFANPDFQVVAAQTASAMQQVPALAAQGLSLQGDLQLQAGNHRGALDTYARLSRKWHSPSVTKRTERARGLPLPARRPASPRTSIRNGEASATDPH